MAPQHSLPWIGPAALFIVFMITAGCISMNIGDVSYISNGVSVAVTNTGEPAEAYLQVTVYDLQNFHQTEVAVFNSSVILLQGENKIVIPGKIAPGRYKLYVYLMQNGSRKTAVIRDIVV